MGTFHQDRGALHGITVVVETDDAGILIGRFDREEPRGIVLLDVARHRPSVAAGIDPAEHEAGEARRRAEFLERAVRFGVFKESDAVIVPRAVVRTIRKLGELAATADAGAGTG